jgi:ribosomal protein L22
MSSFEYPTMSMKRTCAISSRKSDLVSADIRGLGREESTRFERNSKTDPPCQIFSLRATL